MRIDRLEIENFKKFARLGVDLDPHFTVLVGDNGAGKTSLLEALAIAAAIWIEEIPEPLLANSKRSIQLKEIRTEAELRGDRVQFQKHLPAVVRARGQIGDTAGLEWTRQIREDGVRTSNADAKAALQSIQGLLESGANTVMPILAFYGAGRAWLPSNAPKKKAEPKPAQRWAAFYRCFDEKIRLPQLREWFQRETIAAGNNGGAFRPGFEAVKKAILRFVPGADRVWFDPDQAEIVLSISGVAQPFDNLSAGQRMMLALVADLAIKAVTQNAFLLPADRLGPEDEPLPRVLRETSGLVLIDELDVHLHPSWQRRVAADLKSTFPAMQFVCTSHSPQVIGELAPNEIRIISGQVAATPQRSFGMESGRVLEEIMGVASRDADTAKAFARLFVEIEDEQFDAARQTADALEAKVGADDPELGRARGLMDFILEGTGEDRRP